VFEWLYGACASGLRPLLRRDVQTYRPRIKNFWHSMIGRGRIVILTAFLGVNACEVGAADAVHEVRTVRVNDCETAAAGI